MKKTRSVLAALALSLLAGTVFSQNVAINEDGSLPNPNAILDVKSFTKGVLIPRVSTAGRQAIANTKGLLVYDTTTSLFWYNTGTAWQSLSQGAAGWLLNGNAGTDTSSFLGTTDNKPLVIKVNNRPSGRIDVANANTYWGFQTGMFNNPSLATGNSAFGFSSLYTNNAGRFNTANGCISLYSNTTGSYNTACGSNALFANTTGSCNTASGLGSLIGNISGSNNTAIGYFAQSYTSSGDYNTSVGSNSLYNNQSGNHNVAAGYKSMYLNQNGQYNTAIGDLASYRNTEGWLNTAVGYYTLANNQTSNYITAIGYGADIRYSNFGMNSTAIGFNALAYGFDDVRIGNSAINLIEGAVPWYTPSDARFKYQVQEDVKGLDFILQLRPVTYQFDGKQFDEEQRKQLTGDSLATSAMEALKPSYDAAYQVRRSGFIAQEVEKAADASGYNFSGIIKPKTEQDHYSLSYESFVVPLVKAMQEQQKTIIALQQQVAGLTQLVNTMKTSK